MAAETGLNRIEAIGRLLDVVPSYVPADTVTVNGPPRNPQQGKLIAVGDVTGELDSPHLTAGRKRYDDRFTVQLLAVAWDPGGSDHSVCDDTAQQLADGIVSAVAEHPHLQTSTTGSGLQGVVAATAGRLEGPNRWWTAEGAGTAFRVSVDIHTRIH
jgi:hypothetical protein